MAVRGWQVIVGLFILALAGLMLWQGVQPKPYWGKFGTTFDKFDQLFVIKTKDGEAPPPITEPQWQWNYSTIGGILMAFIGLIVTFTSGKKKKKEVEQPFY